jgi:hypothetical protein
VPWCECRPHSASWLLCPAWCVAISLLCFCVIDACRACNTMCACVCRCPLSTAPGLCERAVQCVCTPVLAWWCY